MLDIKKIRKNKDEVCELLNRRNADVDIKKIINLDNQKRELLVEVEQKKSLHNQTSKNIAILKKEKKPIDNITLEMRILSDEINKLDDKIRNIDELIYDLLLAVPNLPNLDVPVGSSENDNMVIRSWGEIPSFNFNIKAHWDLGVDLNILDFERATKISSNRFAIFKGIGASLERALIQYMLDTHIYEHGFTEIAMPFLVNGKSMIGTGQLPKFEEDVFKVQDKDLYLIPTAEVPVTNMYSDEVLDEKALPIYMTGYSPCFRAEASAKGRDTRGLIRNYQFDKVEMVMYSTPEQSYARLEELTGYAEDILKGLKLPYRVVELCAGDLGFSAAKTYDLEVWMPSYHKYVEISSCTNFEDFQARRANIKYKNKSKRTEYIHTLNGSGLAVGRTLAAVLENYQLVDGTVRIPDVLKPYMRGREIIEY